MFHQKFLAKTFSSSEITGSFDHERLWNECIDILDFLHGDIHQENVVSETTTFLLSRRVMLGHTRTRLDLPRVPFGSYRTISRLKLKSDFHLPKMLILFASMKT